jgi:hypothetical protein
MTALRIEIHSCQGCGNQIFTPECDWRTAPAEYKYCQRKECRLLVRKPIYDPHTNDGRLSWATTPVYDPMKELRLELARIEKRKAMVQ